MLDEGLIELTDEPLKEYGAVEGMKLVGVRGRWVCKLEWSEV